MTEQQNMILNAEDTMTETIARELAVSRVDARTLLGLWQGMSNIELADFTGVREGTVKSRLSRLYRQIGVKRRPAAALRVQETLGAANRTATPAPRPVEIGTYLAAQGAPADISAEILLDSITSDGREGYRLTTWLLKYPRFVHSEFMTHRTMSRNSASSRAIPAKKLRERTVSRPVVPLEWGANKPGMQAGAEVEDTSAAEAWWRDGLARAAEMHEAGEALGLHKQIINRVIEPWMTVEVIVSGTEWANFFALRDHRLAEPHIRRLAGLMREAYFSRLPTELPPGGWHLPMVRAEDLDSPDIQILHALGRMCVVNIAGNMTHVDCDMVPVLRKVSVARCARVSYLTHDGRRDLAEDAALHDRLLAPGEPGDPQHLSAFEHAAQATPGQDVGNFRGWCQYRKLFRDEAGPGGLRCERCGVWGGQHVSGCSMDPLLHREGV